MRETVFGRLKLRARHFLEDCRAFLRGFSGFFRTLKSGAGGVKRALAVLKREWEYLHRPENLKSLKLLKEQTVRVLKGISPKRGSGFLRLGLSDPYETGRAMEAAALLYPFYGEKIEVIPEFSQEIFETKLDVKGRVYLFTLLSAALKLFMDKNLRKMYRHFGG